MTEGHLVSRLAGLVRRRTDPPFTSEYVEAQPAAGGSDPRPSSRCGWGIGVAPLTERVPSAFVVFEQGPPTEVLASRREWEFHSARAELSMGALDVGAVEEQVGVREAIRNRTTGFIGLSWAEDKQQILLRWPHLDPSLVAI
jgi:hypothetical protein